MIEDLRSDRGNGRIKKRLERIIDHEILSFSFPFGCADDYDKESISIARNVGFTKIAAVDKKYDEEKYRDYNPPSTSNNN